MTIVQSSRKPYFRQYSITTFSKGNIGDEYAIFESGFKGCVFSEIPAGIFPPLPEGCAGFAVCDSFARKHTSEEFRKYVAEHETDIIRFKAQVLLADIKKDPQKRIEAVNSVVQSIAHIADPVSRDVYIQPAGIFPPLPEGCAGFAVCADSDVMGNSRLIRSCFHFSTNVPLTLATDFAIVSS